MEHVKHGAEHVAERVRKGYDSATEMVQERPVGALAIAFGAGLVAGVLIAMMLRSDA
jgi:ElaB/YqjD/DUF883 family membrane-anchored ribosome-binding protein